MLLHRQPSHRSVTPKIKYLNCTAALVSVFTQRYLVYDPLHRVSSKMDSLLTVLLRPIEFGYSHLLRLALIISESSLYTLAPTCTYISLKIHSLKSSSSFENPSQLNFKQIVISSLHHQVIKKLSKQ